MATRGEEIEVQTDDGAMPVYVVRPVGDAPAPLVVMFMDVNGIRPELKRFAARYAEAGLTVALPDLFHHFGKGIAFDATIPPHERPKEELDRQLGFMRALTDEMVVADAVAIVEAIGGGKRAGCVGYCMGGRHVLRAMSRRPDLFGAGSAHFPTYAVTEAPDSPHRELGAVRGELYVCVGGDDWLMPPEQAEALREALAASGATYEMVLHPGAKHGYAFAERPASYAREAAEQDWVSSIALFQRALA